MSARTGGTIAGIPARIGDTIAVARDVTIAAAAGVDTPVSSGALRGTPVAILADG